MDKSQIRKVIGVAGVILAIGVVIYILMDDEKKEKEINRSPNFDPDFDKNNGISEAVIQDEPIEEQGKVIDLNPSLTMPEAKEVHSISEVEDYIKNLPVEYEEVTTSSQSLGLKKQEEVTPIEAYTHNETKITEPEEIHAPISEEIKESIINEQMSKNNENQEQVADDAPEKNEEIEDQVLSVFPLRLGQKGKEVERLQTWLFKRYGRLIAHTGVFDQETLNLVRKEFGKDQVSEAIYYRHKMHLHLGDQNKVRHNG